MQTHCMPVTMTMKQTWDYHKTGIDVSKAFDINKRKQILDVFFRLGAVKVN